MADAAVDGRSVVTERARELVEALRAAPALQRFQAIDGLFRSDAEVARLQAGLRWKNERLQRAASQGRHDAALFRDVREAQARLQGHPLVIEFLTARAELQEFLREVNGAMTEVLGVDVGASAGRAGGC